jgi:hypothetical protein
MPPTPRGAHASSFIALWVEDLTAKLWSIEMESGAADEIARFAIEGMSRPQILELARQFAKAREGRRGMRTAMAELELTEPSTPTPRKKALKRSRTPRDMAPNARTHNEVIAAQRARQSALYAALAAHGNAGTTSAELSEELGRSGAGGTGVSLGVLRREGKAVQRDGIWYAIPVNGDGAE